jgi:DNA-binding LacI/PurR family transcriptional regulator
MTQTRNHPQALKAYRMILRYLRSRKVAVGELVPTQAELRQELNFSNDTLTRAMKWLVEDGVLERKQRAGTVVLDMSRARLDDHTVMLAMVPHTTLPDEPFYGHLLRALEGYVREILGAQVRIMAHVVDMPGNAVWPMHTFPGLEEMIREGDIDAVICPIAVDPDQTSQFTKLGVPWLHVSSWEKTDAGVVIDQQPMMLQACEMLVQRGCKRLSVVTKDARARNHNRYWNAFVQASEMHGFESAPILEAGDISLEAGRQLARRILKMPARQRPDGMVVINDVLASGLTDVLRDQKAYHPEIAVQANVPGTLIFGLPVIRFDVDIYKLAKQVVHQLMHCWLSPDHPVTRQWLIPHMAHERARDMQTPAMVVAE